MPGAAADLAVVIPAYKADFLHEALESLVKQSDCRFRVYVGDDCGPPEIATAVEAAQDKLDIVYHRFDENLGSRSLMGQWERCIALSNEPWIWLLGDDDVAGPRAVERFYATKAEAADAYDVYRFCQRVIDSRGVPIYTTPPHPGVESATAYLYHWLRMQRKGCASEFIVNRRRYEEVGMPSISVGWAGDVLLCARLAGEKGIKAIPGACVDWRESEQNLSCQDGLDVLRGKLEGHMDVMNVVMQHYREHPQAWAELGADEKRFLAMVRERLTETMGYLFRHIELSDALSVVDRLKLPGDWRPFVKEVWRGARIERCRDRHPVYFRMIERLFFVWR